MKPDLAIKTHLDKNVFILNHEGIRDDEPRKRLALVSIRAILKFTGYVLRPCGKQEISAEKTTKHGNKQPSAALNQGLAVVMLMALSEP